ncbi:Uncharacterised protein [uncultured archaeon]|nr:Uncharacterised protein [uncultured archaeon]
MLPPPGLYKYANSGVYSMEAQRRRKQGGWSDPDALKGFGEAFSEKPGVHKPDAKRSPVDAQASTPFFLTLARSFSFASQTRRLSLETMTFPEYSR